MYYALTLIFVVVSIALVLGDKLEAGRGFAQKHLGDLEPVSAVRRCEQSFWNDRTTLSLDHAGGDLSFRDSPNSLRPR